jgi:5-methylthioadenosine/S-adenosylhomocysteine deaminase
MSHPSGFEEVTELIAPQWIIPVVPRGVCLEGHAVALAGSRIAAVLPLSAARENFPSAPVRTLPGHVLLPGFVNTHTHAAMSLLRGLADDLPLMTWLEQHIWPAEARLVNAAFVADGTRLAVAEMLLGGTTCANDMYFFPDAVARAAGELGMRMVVGLIVIEFPSAWAADTEQYFKRGLEVHDQLRHQDRIRTAFAPHAPYTVSDASLQRIAVLAEELDLPIHMHIHETAFEVAQSIEQHGERPLTRLDRLGLLSPRLIAVHMTQLLPAEIERVAATGCSVVHCPESNLKLASGFAPVAALLAAGVNLAIGTDGAASNNDLDTLAEARTAALLAKGVAGDPAVMPAASTLHALTLGGATALGLEAEIGSIESGKQADLVAIDLQDVSTQPVHDVAAAVVYAAGRRQVREVWVAGEHLVSDGVLLSADLAALRASAGQWWARVHAFE